MKICCTLETEIKKLFELKKKMSNKYRCARRANSFSKSVLFTIRTDLVKKNFSDNTLK